MKHFALVLALLFASVHATLENVFVKRVIDVSSSVPVSKTTITMKNTGEQPAPYFYLAFKCTDAKELADVWVTEKKQSTKRLQALDIEMSSDVPGLDSFCRGYKVSFPEPLAPEAEITVEVRADGSGMLNPAPSEIKGLSPQYMRYEGSSYFYSPYSTKSMRTVLVLQSTDVTSKKGFIDPFKHSKKRIEMGPYTDVAPFSYNQVSVRFKNDRGFLVARLAEKYFYVSHWGTITVREEYQVTNAAARHEGEWSRVDHSSSYTAGYGTALSDVWANLPADAHNVDYRDLIGNITSSRLRGASKEQRPVQLTFRYPMMGGWNNHFWITYDISLKNYLKSTGNEHVVELPIFPSLNTDLLCQKLRVRVLLPDGASDERVIDHPSLKFSMERSIERTTLTVIGRPTFLLGLERVRSKSKHFAVIQVRYKYNEALVWITPLFLGGVVLLLFVSFLACVRNGMSGENEAEKEKLKSS
ncbi:Dolichyl-diphosphooligosaccharide--protein glycosyltransferase subunit 1B [Gracilariopsis chorda]|uniref:Dolichyl-diphosphooligosaccharide--protein glycosyltransferase subunit 1 n=1 Tax=Gracilariopsis chorda TaxID=448386 RepID=A0A2V3IUS3_9FLOR|nr:Dolichyl-diphosphooligosaccharide--protein glycosyltransferase subunit 1B [Gracilariopsis chorda]|eukprot:PXF45447.1 Dolichyl-diphosphooligosaccharide--protein glycosyltransferase subunit 1B [Gracilariopsis chorda]